jgi:hypothetical protein
LQRNRHQQADRASRFVSIKRTRPRISAGPRLRRREHPCSVPIGCAQQQH